MNASIARGDGDDDGEATRIVAPAPVPPAGSGTGGTGGAGGDGAAHEAGLLPVGARVAEFEITRVVGQGGFGVVYEAWDHTLERRVAIKEYLPTALSTRQGDGAVVPLSERHRETFELGMRSFSNEARLLAQFDHPSLVKVYRFWQERGTTYMVMPFYQGDTLRHALAAAAGAVDEDWLLGVMDGITQALGVMHAAHCYHRDIAPDNILLLEGSGRPVVLDFGAARRVISDKTQAMTVILKPGYAPIEQYAEMPDMRQGAWTDVYALAAVMHVAVRGVAPPPSVARLVSDGYEPVSDNAALRQRYGQRLLAAIDAGLAVRPEARPQSMAALRAALGLEEFTPPGAGTTQAVPARPAQARAAPSTSMARSTSTADASGTAPRARRSAVTLAVLGVGAVALLAAGGWWWQGRGDAGTGTGAGQAAAPAGRPVEVAPVAPAAVATAPVPAVPAPVAVPAAASARTPLESLRALAEGASAGFGVTAAPRKAEVAIGKDRLSFELRSTRDGFAYVYMLSSSGELFLMFPNLLDKYNQVKAGATVALPRASWPMNAGGPAGTDEFVVLVSEHARDFGASGLQGDGVFSQFSLPVLAALEAARGGGPTPLLGRPVCPGGAPCADAYGVGAFRIVEK